ncbi:MAG: VWA domain-containing protein [Chitinispirillaceae bacterium]|nr:VWA domain-containing protein [Chitinispirillaceae bacterium]
MRPDVHLSLKDDQFILFVCMGGCMECLKRSLLVLLSTSALFADGFIIFPPPYLTPLSVKYHKVTCAINNGVATTTIDQEFVNNQADGFTGGRYVFPIPQGAVIDQFKVVVDGEAKTATVMSRDTARVFFNEAVKNSNQASLLEYTDNGAYTVEIGAVAPGTSRRIQITYVEVLPKTDGLSRYLYPLNTEKYSMGLIDTVSIVVNINNASPITSVYSPSFPVTLERTDEYSVTATYSSVKSRPGRDFDLYYKLSEDDISFHLFTYKKENEDGYFLMLITPKLKKPEEGETVVAKDIVFTIDRSGSMGGTKIVQARDALRFCINRLLPDDYFNIVAFQSTVGSNGQDLLPATAENVATTREYVDGITATGGTNIAEALTTSLSRMQTEDRPHYCIFLTDGQATVGVTNTAEISALVNEANTGGTRIFSVGFGFDVNTVLIDKISIDNGGCPLYCSPDQNIEEVIGDLYKRIETPVMTSPQLVIANTVPTWGISPSKPPDLFSGSELAMYGRYQGQGACTVILSGNTGEKVETMQYDAVFPATGEAYPFLPRLWATQQIAVLMTKIKLQTLTQEDLTPLIDSVKALSLAYGIVTPYTSSLFVPAGTAVSWTDDLQVESGGRANDASNYMQGMQQNSNAAQTVVSDTNALPYTVAPQLNQMQNVGNKIFVYTSDSVWRDAVYDSTSVADTVYYGSEEYFALAAQNTELRDLLTVGNQAAFNYLGKNYLILDKGAAGIAPKRGSLNASPATTGRFAVRQAGGKITFERTQGMPDGVIDIYSVKGCRIAHMTFEAAATTKTWSTKDRRNSPLSAGAYLAIHRAGNLKAVQKFVVR